MKMSLHYGCFFLKLIINIVLIRCGLKSVFFCRCIRFAVITRDFSNRKLINKEKWAKN